MVKNMVRPERFELPTYRSVVCCSIQLSYGRTFSCASIIADPSTLVNNDGGGGGIRTHGTRMGSTVFKTASLNRSDTPPHLTGESPFKSIAHYRNPCQLSEATSLNQQVGIADLHRPAVRHSSLYLCL